jgi:hypothetical protein
MVFFRGIIIIDGDRLRAAAVRVLGSDVGSDELRHMNRKAESGKLSFVSRLA